MAITIMSVEEVIPATIERDMVKDDLKEAIELMLQLDDDKNYSLSDIERDKYAKMLKRLK